MKKPINENKFIKGEMVTTSLQENPLKINGFQWNGYTWMYSFEGTDLRCGEEYIKLFQSHQIDFEGLVSWCNEQRILFAMSTREKKRLLVTLRGGFVLTVDDKEVWSGKDPLVAVQKYNDVVL